MIREEDKEIFSRNREMLGNATQYIESGLLDKDEIHQLINNMNLSYTNLEKRKIQELKQSIKNEESNITEEYTKIQNEIKPLQKELESEQIKNARLNQYPEKNERALRKSNEVIDRINTNIYNKTIRLNELQDNLNAINDDKNYLKDTVIPSYNKNVLKISNLAESAKDKYGIEEIKVDDVPIVDNITRGNEPALLEGKEKKNLFSRIKGLFAKKSNVNLEVEQEMQRDEYIEQTKKDIDDIFEKARKREEEKRQAMMNEPNDFEELKELEKEAIGDVEEEQRLKEEQETEQHEVLDSDEIRQEMNEAIKSVKKEELSKNISEKLKNAKQELGKAAVVGAAVGIGAGGVFVAGQDAVKESNASDVVTQEESSLEKNTTGKTTHKSNTGLEFSDELGSQVDDILDGKSENITVDTDAIFQNEEGTTTLEENNDISAEETQVFGNDEVNLDESSIELDNSEANTQMVSDNAETYTLEELADSQETRWQTSVDDATQGKLLDMIKGIGNGSSKVKDNLGNALMLKMSYSSQDLVNSLRNAMLDGTLSQNDMDSFISAAQKDGWNISTVCNMLGISEDLVFEFTGKDASEYQKDNVQEQTASAPEQEIVTEEQTTVAPEQEIVTEEPTVGDPPIQETVTEEPTEGTGTEELTVGVPPIQEVVIEEPIVGTPPMQIEEEETTAVPEQEVVEEENNTNTSVEETKTPEQLAAEKQALINDIIEAYSKGDMTAEQVSQAAKENNIQKSDFSQEQMDKAFGVIMQKEGLSGALKIQEMLSKNAEDDMSR